MNRRMTSLALLAWLTCAYSTHAAAADAPVPGAVQPGQIERQFRETPRPQAMPAPIVQPPAPVQAAPAKADEVRFVLKQVKLEGATVYTEDQLRPYFADLIDKEIALSEIYALADRLTARYRNDGYILTQVIVPEQRIVVEEGAVQLRVIEGYVDQVRFDGKTIGPREVLESYAAKIKETRPLNARALERYLLLMNDLGGVIARATLSPSQTVGGASDLSITLTGDKFFGDAGVTNRNSRALGPWRINANADMYSLLGRYDHTGVRAATTVDDELNFIALVHDMRVGSEGGRLGVTVSYARANPEQAANLPPDLQSESTMGGVTYTYPWIRSRTRNLYLRASFTFHDGRTDFADTRLSEDKLRALRIGATFDHADRWRGINLFDVEFSQGLNVLGATESGAATLSRADGRSDFSKLALYGARLQAIAGGWSTLIAASGQFAFTPLLGAEQWAYGGEPFGRAYDPSEIVGDAGAAIKIEPRYTQALTSRGFQSYTAYAFYDLGKVWRRDAVDQKSNESAAAVGAGVRLTMAKGYAGFIELAKSTTHVVQAEGDDVRIFGGVSKRF